tara:strand:- start:274 stop:1197 length:924 start_codon:yes stop_codon:yes gene_type:complete
MAHHHSNRRARYRRAFGLGVALNVGFVIVEFIFGALVDSLVLIADAGHNLSDVLGLLLAWGAFFVADKSPSRNFTYGLRKATILAALLSATLLLVALGAIAWEAMLRFREPRAIDAPTVLIVASIGVVINAVTAWLFYADREDDLNIKGAYLHMAADALVSLGVVATAVTIAVTGWFWLDPAISLAVVTVVFIGTWGLLRDSARLSLDAAPRNVDLLAIEQWLLQQPGVQSLHDLHVWAMSTTQNALTVHLVAQDDVRDCDAHSISLELQSLFEIPHITIQVETTSSPCSLGCLENPTHRQDGSPHP